MSRLPARHGRDHRPGGYDPIPGLDGFLHWGSNNDTDELGLQLDSVGSFTWNTGPLVWRPDGGGWDLETDGGGIILRAVGGGIDLSSATGNASLYTNGSTARASVTAPNARIDVGGPGSFDPGVKVSLQDTGFKFQVVDQLDAVIFAIDEDGTITGDFDIDGGGP